MSSFLENPEERIGSFSNSLSEKLGASTKSQKVRTEVSFLKKKMSAKKNDNTESTLEQKSVQIRISQQVEQRIRETLLETYKNTGRKIKFREYADRALLEFISTFEKDFK